jgi:hypothetical protein
MSLRSGSPVANPKSGPSLFSAYHVIMLFFNFTYPLRCFRALPGLRVTQVEDHSMITRGNLLQQGLPKRRHRSGDMNACRTRLPKSNCPRRGPKSNPPKLGTSANNALPVLRRVPVRNAFQRATKKRRRHAHGWPPLPVIKPCIHIHT